MEKRIQTEEYLIIKYQEIKQRLKELRSKIQDSTEEDELADLSKEMDEKNIEFEQGTDDLDAAEDKGLSTKVFTAVKHKAKKLESIVLKCNNSGESISRNQGTAIHNCFIGQIMVEIQGPLNLDFSDFPSQFLFTTTKESDQVDGIKLLKCIRDFIMQLNTVNDMNYIALDQLYDSFIADLFRTFDTK